MSSLNRSQANGFQLSNTVNKGIDFYKPKYHNDGLGRDGYVELNNGGLNRAYHSPTKSFGDGRQLYVGNSQGGPRQNIYQEVKSKKINYELDGTGRDSYIYDINGGFYPQKTVASYAQCYQNQLRIGHRKDPTEFYMARRNSRMGKFHENRISKMDKLVKDKSRDNSTKR